MVTDGTSNAKRKVQRSAVEEEVILDIYYDEGVNNGNDVFEIDITEKWIYNDVFCTINGDIKTL